MFALNYVLYCRNDTVSGKKTFPHEQCARVNSDELYITMNITCACIQRHIRASAYHEIDLNKNQFEAVKWLTADTEH